MRRRRRTSRSRSQWRSQAWGYTPIGDINANGHFACPTLQAPGTQAFWPVLVNQMFGPEPDAADTPVKQERVLCLRTIGEIDIFYTRMGYSEGTPEEMPAQCRWVLALLDEEAVQDTTYLFTSLFLPMFHQSERVLLTGIAKPITEWSSSADGGDEIEPRLISRITWDQKLRTKVETGSTLWLVTEFAFCDEANPVPMRGSGYLLGYTRALWRD